ncbi:MAG: hypothetical protein EXR72_02670 [Myxococcales bacterium]|nr:hypothetical protein [Myxococcales bacterium]
MMDQTQGGTALPAIHFPGFSPVAVGVGRSLGADVLTVSAAPSAIIKTKVDGMGNMTPPDLISPPKGADRCPAGSRCLLKDSPKSEPGSAGFSDFRDLFPKSCLRRASYDYLLDGCPGVTRWYAVRLEGDVPANSSLAVSARSGRPPAPNPEWGPWTPDSVGSPLDLQGAAQLHPNDQPALHLQVRVRLDASADEVTPTLKAFDVAYRCPAAIDLPLR